MKSGGAKSCEVPLSLLYAIESERTSLSRDETGKVSKSTFRAVIFRRSQELRRAQGESSALRQV